ncbi:MAG TPA: polyprenyl synthetase family protein, partial [Hyphomicrobiaceae bacterium]|nr:polyprenyl synthetase family protein [Hyphomicrobiaceae bacterium]
MTSAALEQRLTEWAREVEDFLDRRLSAGSSIPDRLLAAMRHAMLGGGKRIRPFLVIESAALFGLDHTVSLIPAAGVECLHGYSL